MKLSRSADLDVLAILLDVGLMLENAAVFQSQLGDQLIALRSVGLSVGIAAVYRDKAKFDRVIGERLCNAGVKLFLVRDAGFVRNFIAMIKLLRSIRKSTNTRRAYVRGLWSPILLRIAGGSVPYVYDVRGSLADECAAVGMSRWKLWFYTFLERWGLSRAEKISAVTTPLAQKMAKSFARTDVAVVPCCIEFQAHHVESTAAAGKRRLLGYSPSDVIFVYSGGLSHYQQVPATLALWRRLLDQPDIRFLLLTNDTPHSLPTIVGDLGDFGERLKHLSLPREEIPEVLASADVGFMLRESRELNFVASPVKFAEYMAAGLAIVASPGIGDASDQIQQHALGVLVNPADLESGERLLRELLVHVRQHRDELRTRALSLARAHYDWSAYTRTFLDLYGSPTLLSK